MLKAVRKSFGFTLIEILVVVAIISALAVAVSVALDPAKRINEAQDARRQADVDSILTAVHQYIVDNKGGIPSGLSATEQQLGTDTTGCAISTGTCAVTPAACLNLTTPLAPYLKTIPLDPEGATAGKTKYSAVRDSNGIVTVKACGAEVATSISASR